MLSTRIILLHLYVDVKRRGDPKQGTGVGDCLSGPPQQLGASRSIAMRRSPCGGQGFVYAGNDRETGRTLESDP